jgi:hypothetical protein
VTLSLIAVVAYFAYKVYWQGKLFFIDPNAQQEQKEYIVDE